MTNLSPEALKRKRAYDAEYTKKFFLRKLITFNKQIPEEVEMFEWVKSQKNGNVYIHNLIREDMHKQKEAQKDV